MNFICDNPAVKAISFVGSNQAGEYIYQRGSTHGKRVQSNMVRTGDTMLLVVLRDHLPHTAQTPALLIPVRSGCYFPCWQERLKTRSPI